MCLGYYVNPINPENKTNLDTVIEGTRDNPKDFSYNILDAGTINSWSGKVATFAAGHSVLVNDYLLTIGTESGVIIGKVSHVAGNDVTIVNEHKSVLTSNEPEYPTGVIKRIRYSDAQSSGQITGFGKDGGYLLKEKKLIYLKQSYKVANGGFSVAVIQVIGIKNIHS